MSNVIDMALENMERVSGGSALRTPRGDCGPSLPAMRDLCSTRPATVRAIAAEADALDAMNAAARVRFGLPPVVRQERIEDRGWKMDEEAAPFIKPLREKKLPPPGGYPDVNGTRVECMDLATGREMQELVNAVCGLYGARAFFVRARRLPAGSVDHIRNAPMITVRAGKKALNGLWAVATEGYYYRGLKHELKPELVLRIRKLCAFRSSKFEVQSSESANAGGVA